jgi:hypothetical protein
VTTPSRTQTEAAAAIRALRKRHRVTLAEAGAWGAGAGVASVWLAHHPPLPWHALAWQGRARDEPACSTATGPTAADALAGVGLTPPPKVCAVVP